MESIPTLTTHHPFQICFTHPLKLLTVKITTSRQRGNGKKDDKNSKSPSAYSVPDAYLEPNNHHSMIPILQMRQFEASRAMKLDQGSETTKWERKTHSQVCLTSKPPNLKI